MSNKKLLMLDLDGTVRRGKTDPRGYINAPDDQELIPEAKAAIARYVREGWTIVGITNQGGVEAGHKTITEAIAEQRFTQGIVQDIARTIERARFDPPSPILSAIYFCPDFAGQQCWYIPYGELATPMHDREWVAQPWMPEPPSSLVGTFRKPRPGMLKLALQTPQGWGDVLFVGDRPEDKQAAAAAGVPFMQAEEWRGTVA